MKRVRPIGKRLNPVIRSLNKLHRDIFRDCEAHLAKQMDKITDRHMQLAGTPNFFFRGQTYLKSKAYNVVVLSDELRAQAAEYVLAVENLDKSKRTVSSYFGKLYSVKNEDHLYYLVPSTAQQYLEKPLVDEPDFIDDILDGSHQEAFNVITSQALYKLIT